MDFVTYQNKDTGQITVLSFIEQNDELCLRLDQLVLNQPSEPETQRTLNGISERSERLERREVRASIEQA